MRGWCWRWLLIGFVGIVAAACGDDDASDDASVVDAGIPVDAATTDAAPAPDAAVNADDAASPDAPIPDAALPDAPIPDAAAPDAPDLDASEADAASGPVEITITQSTATTITAGNSIACVVQDSVTGVPLYHRESGYYRVFALSSYGVTSDFDVSSVTVGIESAAAGTGGVQPASVRLYTLSGALSLANLTAIGSATTSIGDTTTAVLVDVPVTGTAPAGSVLVVEFQMPDGEPDGNLLFAGSNSAGQSGPTYLRAPDCGAPEPSDLATLGFPDMHWVVTVTGTYVP